MTRHFYMLMRKKAPPPKKPLTKNTKPRFIRVHSGIYNFSFDDVSYLLIDFISIEP